MGGARVWGGWVGLAGRRGLLILTGIATVLGTACGGSAVGARAPAIPLRVLANGGPIVSGPFVAATSLSDLRALLAAANGPDCGPSACFASAAIPAEPSLLLALPLEVPCTRATGATATITDSGGQGRPAELTVSASEQPLVCRVDPAAPVPAGRLSLVQIPLASLPTAVVIVRLRHTGASNRELGSMAPYAATIIDLRHPADVAPAPGLRTAAALAAIADAKEDAELQLKGVTPASPLSLTLLGTTRWGEANLDCLGVVPIPRPGMGHAGYLIQLKDSGHLLEYHSSRGKTIFCGGTELPGHGDGSGGGGMDHGMDHSM